MSDYRLKVSVQNANIVRAIAEAGFKSVAEMCRLFELQQTDVNQFVNFRRSPVAKGGGLTPAAESLCIALGKLPEDLWTDEQLGLRLPRNVAFMDVSEDQMEQALRQLDHVKMIKALQNKANLSNRKLELLSMRNEEEYTQKEAGQLLGVGPNRARQIEEEALRSLRKASRSVGGRQAADI